MAWLEPNKKTVAKLKREGKMKRNIQLKYHEPGTPLKIDGKRIPPKSISTGTKNWKEAQEFKVDFEKKLNAQLETGIEEITLLDAFQEHLKMFPKLDAKSRQIYTNYINHFLRYVETCTEYDRNIYMHQITPEMFIDFRDFYCEKIEKIKRNGEVVTVQRLADLTQARTLERIRSVVKMAMKRGYMPKRELADFGLIPKSQIEQKKIRAFTNPELKLILDDEDIHNNIRRCFMGLLYTGCRVGELCQLDWQDIEMPNSDGETGFINIVHDPENGKKTKTKRSRRIPIAERLLAELKQMKIENDSRKNPYEYVFCNEYNERLNIKKIYDRLICTCKKHDINSGVTTHSFRHTFCQNTLRSGIDFKTIMNWTGHSDIKTFLIYLREYVPEPQIINNVRYDFI